MAIKVFGQSCNFGICLFLGCELEVSVAFRVVVVANDEATALMW